MITIVYIIQVFLSSIAALHGQHQCPRICSEVPTAQESSAPTGESVGTTFGNCALDLARP